MTIVRDITVHEDGRITRECYGHVLVFTEWGWVSEDSDIDEWIAARKKEAEPPPPAKPEDMVYFLRTGDYIKVGWTKNIQRRLKQYPPNVEILALRYGDKVDEQSYHALLTPWRVAGREWYEAHERVLELIAEVVRDYGPPKLEHTVSWTKPKGQTVYNRGHGRDVLRSW